MNTIKCVLTRVRKDLKVNDSRQTVVVQVFKPSTQEAKTGGSLCKFGVSLVYRVSSRTSRAKQRNPVLKQKCIN